MFRELSEADWKYMRRLSPELLNRLCARINAETASILADMSLSEHERYLKVYKHIHESDRIVAECFNDWRRSRLLERIISIIHFDLITEEELAGLSEEGRAIVGFIQRV